MARDREGSGVSRRWRGLSLLLIGLVGGTLMLAPAGAHIGTPGHLWKTHIKPKADKRYLRRGPVRISHSGQFSLNWSNVGNTELRDYLDATQIWATGAGNKYIQLHLVAPDQIGTKGNYGLKKVEICYRVTPGDRIDWAGIYDNRVNWTDTRVLDDATDRTSTTDACYVVSSASPIDPAGSLLLVLMFAANAPGDYVILNSVASTWVPAGGGTMSPVSPGASADLGPGVTTLDQE